MAADTTNRSLDFFVENLPSGLALGCRIGGGLVRPAVTLPGAGGKVRCAPGPFGFEGVEPMRNLTLELLAGQEPIDATTGQ
jgi:hypothetical protein